MVFVSNLHQFTYAISFLVHCFWCGFFWSLLTWEGIVKRAINKTNCMRDFFKFCYLILKLTCLSLTVIVWQVLECRNLWQRPRLYPQIASHRHKGSDAGEDQHPSPRLFGYQVRNPGSHNQIPQRQHYPMPSSSGYHYCLRGLGSPLVHCWAFNRQAQFKVRGAQRRDPKPSWGF